MTLVVLNPAAEVIAMKRVLAFAKICFMPLGAISIAGCSDVFDSIGNRATYSANTGEIGLQLQVGATTVNSANYVISNGINTYQGTIWVADASALLAVIGGIEAGTGYTLTLSATGSNGVPCSGASAPFSVIAHATVIVGIQLVCRPSNDAGSVKIEGTFAACANFEAVSADVPLGNQIQLSASTSPALPMPPAAFSWVVTQGAGTLSSNAAPTPVYTCASSDSEVHFDLTLSQSGASICTSTFHLIINCPPDDGQPTPIGDGG